MPIVIAPQEKQELFLSSPADIVLYGGAAGGGKSWSLLAEPLRHIKKKNFGGVIFRREREQITNEGSLWHESAEMYSLFNANANNSNLFWRFPSGARVGFAGLQYEQSVYKWQGSQIAYLGFDELTHFEKFQFLYMMSRNRSKAAVKSYVRATTNPDADSWVAEMINWWIDQDSGFPIEERSGIIRYFVYDGEQFHWANNRARLAGKFPHLAKLYGDDSFCKSFTFIPADVFDNQELLKKDPAYLANLLSQPLIERERLLLGNWKIRAAAGKVFNRAWFGTPVEGVANGGLDVRFWDLAATEKEIKKTGKKNDPDYTATVKIRYKDNTWIVLDAFQIQTAPANVEKLVFQTAEMDARAARRDGCRYKLRWEREPGSASVRESYNWTSKLAGIDAAGVVDRRDKLERAKACSVQAEAGNIRLKKGFWNDELLSNLHGYPDLPHDDLLDAMSGAFNESVDSAYGMSD